MRAISRLNTHFDLKLSAMEVLDKALLADLADKISALKASGGGKGWQPSACVHWLAGDEEPGAAASSSAAAVIVRLGVLLCLIVHDSDGAPANYACVDANVTDLLLSFCNTSLTIPERVADLLSRLSIEEKMNLTWTRGDNGDGGVPRLGIPTYTWVSNPNLNNPGREFDEGIRDLVPGNKTHESPP